MLTKWTSKIPKKDVNGFKAQVMSAEPVLERLKEILEKDLESINKDMSSRDYNYESWAYRQADSIGSIRAYESVIKLVESALKGNK